MDKQEYYTINEVSELLKVAYLTVYRWVQQENIEAIKVGKQYRISKESLDIFLTKSKYGKPKKDN